MSSNIKQQATAQDIADMLNGASIDFDEALKAVADRYNLPSPHIDNNYIAITLGFADALGQIAKLDIETVKLGIKIFLSQWNDSEAMFSQMMEIAEDASYFEWQELGGKVIFKASEGEDKRILMCRLARSYCAPALKDIANTTPKIELLQGWHYKSWEEWYGVFKQTAGNVNPKLEVSNGRSMLDWMDHEPLKKAYKDKVEPKSLAKAFAMQYDFSNLIP